MSHLLNQREASGLLRLSTRTLERLRLSGNGPQYVKLGRRVLYRDADLAEWIANRITRSTSEVRS